MLYLFSGILSLIGGMSVYMILSLQFSPAGVWNGADLLGVAVLLVSVFYSAHLFSKGEEKSNAELVKRLQETEYDD